MSWSRLHVADVHRGDHRSKLAIMRWIVPMIKIIWPITSSLGGSGVGHSRRDHEGLVFCADRLCRATTRWMSARSKIITSRSGDHWESVTRGPAWEKAALAATASTCLAPLGLTPRRGSAHRHRSGQIQRLGQPDLALGACRVLPHAEDVWKRAGASFLIMTRPAPRSLTGLS